MTPGLGGFAALPSSPPPLPLITALRREFGKGGVLYHAQDDAESLYRVEEGLVKLSLELASGRERIIQLAGPGDYLGALTGAARYGERAEALSAKVSVSEIAKDHAEGLRDELLRATGDQLGRVRDALEDSDLPVAARLARTLLRLGARFGHVSEAGYVHLTLPLTHDTLAALVGAARETTTALIGEMRARGVLSGTRGRYSFQPGALRDFAYEAAL
jgi:CRP/FNR family transcriptional regulator, cyclic AMP receptor protein